jgi:murein L,D-transpeptidase YcbB/YkuD
MTKYKKIAATAVLAAMTSLNAFPQAAEAATLLDLLRGGPGKSSPRSGMGTIFEPQARGGLEMGDPEPLPKVAGPRYYTYKAEATRPVAIKAPTVPAAPDVNTTSPAVASDQPQVRRFLAETGVRAPDEIAAAVETYYKDNKPLIWVTDAGSPIGRACHAGPEPAAKPDLHRMITQSHCRQRPPIRPTRTSLPASLQGSKWRSPPSS